MSAASQRGPYEGAVQILRYNRRFFALAGLAALAASAAAASGGLPPAPRVVLALFAAGVVAGGATSLLVSHYVYDRSGLHRWEWLREGLGAPPARWTVLHAGLDEASAALRRLYPSAAGAVLDIYDAREMPEPSIAVARRTTTQPEPALRSAPTALPLRDAVNDLVVLFFVAHELRRPAAREALFREVRRSLRPTGRLVLVEHLRDLPNLLAFGPGVLHFLPRAEWLRVARAAALVVRHEQRITLFVRAFFLEPAA